MVESERPDNALDTVARQIHTLDTNHIIFANVKTA